MNRLKNFFWAFLALKLIDVYVAQECNYAYVTCISCNQYQTCINGLWQNVLDGGRICNNLVLVKCQALLKNHTVMAYAIANEECTDIGIFRNKIFESKFFVCLSDSNSGFVRLDFSCFDDEYFDEMNLQCEPKAFTASGNQTVSATTVADMEETTSFTDEDEFTIETESLTTEMDLTYPLTTEIVASSESPETNLSTTVTADVSSEEVSTPKTTTAASENSDNSTKSSEPSGSPSLTSTSSTVSTTSSASICTAPGIFPDPINCKRYYRCSTTLVKFDYLCPGNSHFNEIEMKCSLIMTPTCLNQTLWNSTTTSLSLLTTQSSATNSTQTFPPATTANPTIADFFPFQNTTSFVTTTTTLVTSTSTPNTPSTTSVTFKCSGPGVFADPTSCKTYYRCSSTNVPFTYRCPGNTYFNNVTQKCGTKIPFNCRKSR